MNNDFLTLAPDNDSSFPAPTQPEENNEYAEHEHERNQEQGTEHEPANEVDAFWDLDWLPGVVQEDLFAAPASTTGPAGTTSNVCPLLHPSVQDHLPPPPPPPKNDELASQRQLLLTRATSAHEGNDPSSQIAVLRVLGGKKRALHGQRLCNYAALKVARVQQFGTAWLASLVEVPSTWNLQSKCPQMQLSCDVPLPLCKGKKTSDRKGPIRRTRRLLCVRGEHVLCLGCAKHYRACPQCAGNSEQGHY